MGVPAKVKCSLARHYAEALDAGNADLIFYFSIYTNIWSYAIPHEMVFRPQFKNITNQECNKTSIQQNRNRCDETIQNWVFHLFEVASIMIQRWKKITAIKIKLTLCQSISRSSTVIKFGRFVASYICQQSIRQSDKTWNRVVFNFLDYNTEVLKMMEI